MASSSASPIRLELRTDGIAVFTIDVPSASQNVLGEDCFAAFEGLLTDLERTRPPPRAAVIRSGKPGGFIAGADIAMFGRMKTPLDLQRLVEGGQCLFGRLARLPMPVVTAIHGVCLGAGLELALSTTYRIGTPAAKLGLPEVKLGLLPAAGGCQRLPRLIGIQAALGAMTAGKIMKAPAAKKSGLLDEVVEPEALDRTAVQAALELASGKLKPVRKSGGLARWALEGNPVGRSFLWRQAEKSIKAAAGAHYPAPLAILRAVKAGVEEGEAAGLAVEAQEFGRLGFTPSSKALRGLFFAEKETKKNPFPGVKAAEVHTLGVLGAGLMGAGIALVGAAPGSFDVLLRDRDTASLRRGEVQIADALAARVKRKQLTKFQADAIESKVLGSTDAEEGGVAWRRAFKRADMIIEAVPEVLKLKHAVFAELEGVVGEHAVLATNTSALPIHSVAAGAPAALAPRILGAHFFSPADRMPLVELVPHAGTAPATSATALAALQRMGKTVIVVKDVPGFFVNRSLSPMLAELLALVQAGVQVDIIDRAVKAFGMPVGPGELADAVGLDTTLRVLETMTDALGPRMAGPSVKGMREAVEAGHMGKKSGRGFFEYAAPGKGDKKKEGKGPRPVNSAMFSLQRKHHIPAQGYSPADVAALIAPGAEGLLTDRLLLRFVSEVIHSLQDGVVRSAGDADIGAVFGLGFPPFHGGPLRYVDARGPANVLAALERLERSVGPAYAPPALLKSLVASGKSFHGE
jgi:enoyl-CoA hydratase/long-chain 3-hydroxyacyl-CoA dehydrogenase